MHVREEKCLAVGPLSKGDKLQANPPQIGYQTDLLGFQPLSDFPYCLNSSSASHSPRHTTAGDLSFKMISVNRWKVQRKK